MTSPFHVLAIETSCDETAAAIVRDGRHVVANVVSTQVELHQQYGGVVPEIASRQHMHTMLPVVEETFRKSGCSWADLDAVAVTRGPGLAGSLLVGVNTAKAFALAKDLPLIGVNHMEAHIYGNWLVPSDEELASLQPAGIRRRGAAHDLMREPRFPLVCLIVSGGHTELVHMRGHGDYNLLGRTRDDAAGEAFDKVARLLGLPYPGGPSIQAAAEQGRSDAIAFPRGMLRAGYEFSFSGLKTAVARLRETQSAYDMADIAASFEQAVCDVLVSKTLRAADDLGVKQIALAGGVAANVRLRQQLRDATELPVRIPPIRFCTDNAAIVGSVAYYQHLAGRVIDLAMDIEPNLSLAMNELVAF
jgi:N6-L-threonylcarbamoyladenine synthase